MSKKKVSGAMPHKKQVFLVLSLILAAVILVCAVCVRCSNYFGSGESHTLEAIRKLSGSNVVTSMEDTANLQRRQEMLIDSRTKYPDMIAWLTIPGTMIDYPVMQGDDNQYYKNHSFDGEVDVYGTPFLSFDHAPDFSDTISMIYGRDMANGTMFSVLNDFLESETFDTVTEGVLVMPDCMYRLTILACTVRGDDITDRVLTAADCSGISIILEDAVQSHKAEISADKQYLILSTSSDGHSGKHPLLLAEMTQMEI